MWHRNGDEWDGYFSWQIRLSGGADNKPAPDGEMYFMMSLLFAANRWNDSQYMEDAQYILDKISMRDGWGNDFYYYSPAPYQSYVIWSAGPNGRTFPPWVSRESLGSQASACVSYWTKDDLIHLSH